jgi:hypothetical protein
MNCAAHDWTPTGERASYIDFTHKRLRKGTTFHDRCVVPAIFLHCRRCPAEGFRIMNRPDSKIVYIIPKETE